MKRGGKSPAPLSRGCRAPCAVTLPVRGAVIRGPLTIRPTASLLRRTAATGSATGSPSRSAGAGVFARVSLPSWSEDSAETATSLRKRVRPRTNERGRSWSPPIPGAANTAEGQGRGFDESPGQVSAWQSAPPESNPGASDEVSAGADSWFRLIDRSDETRAHRQDGCPPCARSTPLPLVHVKHPSKGVNRREPGGRESTPWARGQGWTTYRHGTPTRSRLLPTPPGRSPRLARGVTCRAGSALPCRPDDGRLPPSIR